MQFNPIPQFLPKLLGGMLLLGGSLAAFAMEPKVVASIKPVHSLAAGVMQGVGEPRLLVSGGALRRMNTASNLRIPAPLVKLSLCSGSGRIWRVSWSSR